MKYKKDFLLALDQTNIKTLYAKIVAYDINEQPIEWIHGYFTGGSINVDGASAVRRTCSLTMFTMEKFNEYIWVPKTRFKLYIGVENTLQDEFQVFDDIIWFNQGEYIITSFAASVSTQGHTINISGKDKMCLANGEISGSFEAQTDIGVEEIITLDEDEQEIVTKRKIPIKSIIRKMIQHYIGEPPQNIIINDIEDYGLELLNYYGDSSIYAFCNSSGEYVDITLDENTEVTFNRSQTTIKQLLNNSQFIFDTPGRGGTDITTASTVTRNGVNYTILRIQPGQIAGYKLTELVYPEDLIANIGDNVCTILDKIIQVFPTFEYFYNTNGQFVFQKKRMYSDASFNSLAITGTNTFTTAFSPSIYNFYDNKLITSISNNSTLPSIKNDFSIWGQRNSGDSKIGFHLRYAISDKPTCYKTLELNQSDEILYKKLTGIQNVTNYQKTSKFYYTQDYIGSKPTGAIQADWRELIYQMANDYFKANYFDDFASRLAKANANYENVIINGKTGYEHFYTDIQGFWRYLYQPSEEKDELHNIQDGNYYWNDAIKDPGTLIFWFDFLPSLGKAAKEFSIQQIGDKLKTTNNKISTIYYNIPMLIYYTDNDDISGDNYRTGYRYIHLTEEMASLFNISSYQGNAFEVLNDQLQNDFFERQNISLNTIAVYYLEPNNLLLLQDKDNGIQGEYIINQFSYSLNNGTMNISASNISPFIK